MCMALWCRLVTKAARLVLDRLWGRAGSAGEGEGPLSTATVAGAEGAVGTAAAVRAEAEGSNCAGAGSFLSSLAPSAAGRLVGGDGQGGTAGMLAVRLPVLASPYEASPDGAAALQKQLRGVHSIEVRARRQESAASVSAATVAASPSPSPPLPDASAYACYCMHLPCLLFCGKFSHGLRDH